MKFKIPALFIGLMAFMASCDDLSLINYDMDFTTAALIINATTNPDTSYVLESNFIDPKSELDANGVDADLIKSASIISITIDLVSPVTGNFNWAKSATVIITADGQPEMEVATITEIAPDLTSIELTGLDIELTEYIKGGMFSFKLEAVNDEIIPVDHEVTVTSTFNVEV